jgi:hypothetical protein
MNDHDTTATAAIGRSRNPKVFLDLVGPAVRGLVLSRGRQGRLTTVSTRNDAQFVWDYQRDRPELAKLYEAAKRSQWNATTDLDWSIDVDPHHPERDLVPDSWLPLADVAQYRLLPKREQQLHRAALTAWILSQFLHGEQGALYAACQVTEALTLMDGKLYGSTQVVDEGRHIEVFHRYLAEKLGRIYRIDDNLYTILDALMTDGRWDLKFLGMQIMVEGLALGAFGTLRAATREPLLRELLKYVITDEARHVTFGVVALREHFERMPEAERREREDWAYEITVLMRNRFLGHEFYDEFYGHVMTRKEWDRIVLESDFMRRFRQTMFRRLIPNLRRIHLLSDRVRPHYDRLGLLEYENGRAAPDMSVADVLAENDVAR